MRCGVQNGENARLHVIGLFWGWGVGGGDRRVRDWGGGGAVARAWPPACREDDQECHITTRSTDSMRNGLATVVIPRKLGTA